MNLQVLPINTALTVLSVIFSLGALAMVMGTIINWNSGNGDTWAGFTALYLLLSGFVFGVGVCGTTTCKVKTEDVRGRVVKWSAGAIVIINSKEFPVNNIHFYNEIQEGTNTFSLITEYNFYGIPTQKIATK